MKLRLTWGSGAWAALALAATSLLSSPVLAEEGMWPFDHLPKAALKKKYDFDATDAWVAHLRKASVRLAGGCSGSFVSGTGLTLTNHHCAQDCISRLATP